MDKDTYLGLNFQNKKLLISLMNVFTFIYFCRSSFINFALTMNINTTIVAGMIIGVFGVSFIIYTVRHLNKICWDGLLLIFATALFFYITLLVHPEYKPRFDDIGFDGRFSVKTVFKFGAAIYTYYFIRLYKNEDEKLFRVFSVLGYAIFFLNIWTLILNRSREYKMDFGYQMEISAIILLAQYLYDKSKNGLFNLFLSLIAIATGILYGSRACILGYFAFAVLFFMWKRKLNGKQMMIIMLGLIAVSLYSSDAFMIMLYNFFVSIGIHSRTLYYIAAGDILSVDTARQERIWPVLIEELKNNSIFTIRGAYGGRYVLSMRWPYEHNIVLEILLTFSVFIGVIIILWFVLKTIKLLRNDKGYGGLLTLIFCSFSICRLMFSSSFWYEPYFWAYFAILVNHIFNKRKIILSPNKG